jgi:hypothetical protein
MKPKFIKARPALLPPSKTLVCPNPRCKRTHALVWHVDSKGKRHLSYYCDRVERQARAKHDGTAIIVMTTQRRMAPENVVAADGVPEELTTPAAEKISDKQQLQMPLMIPR